jgi:hypothetical protein
MSAYQPIQMQDFKAPDFAEALLQARQLQQQKERDRAAMLRDQWAQVRDQGAAQREEQRIGLERTRLGNMEADRLDERAIQDRERQARVATEITKLHQAGLGHQA